MPNVSPSIRFMYYAKIWRTETAPGLRISPQITACLPPTVYRPDHPRRKVKTSHFIFIFSLNRARLMPYGAAPGFGIRHTTPAEAFIWHRAHPQRSARQAEPRSGLVLQLRVKLLVQYHSSHLSIYQTFSHGLLVPAGSGTQTLPAISYHSQSGIIPKRARLKPPHLSCAAIVSSCAKEP